MTTTVPSKGDLDKILVRLDALEAAVKAIPSYDGGTP